MGGPLPTATEMDIHALRHRVIELENKLAEASGLATSLSEEVEAALDAREEAALESSKLQGTIDALRCKGGEDLTSQAPLLDVPSYALERQAKAKESVRRAEQQVKEAEDALEKARSLHQQKLDQRDAALQEARSSFQQEELSQRDAALREAQQRMVDMDPEFLRLCTAL